MQITSPETSDIFQRHVSEKLKTPPHWIKQGDYYPLAVIQVGLQEAATRKLQNIKWDFASLEKILKESRVLVVFSVFPASDWALERNRRIDQINYWLWGWCWDQGFRYYDLGRPLRDQVCGHQMESN